MKKWKMVYERQDISDIEKELLNILSHHNSVILPELCHMVFNESVFVESRKHYVSAIVAYENKRSYGEICINNQPDLNKEIYISVSRYLRICEEQIRITKLLENIGIRPIIIKGTVSSLDYPKPELRTCGDIDVILEGDYKRATELLEKDGYICINNDYDNERHIILKKSIFVLEIHKYWAEDNARSRSAPKNAKYMNNLISNGCLNARKVGIVDYYYALPQKEHGIILLQHINQHLSNGIGLRQVLDWRMYVSKNLDNKLWTEEFESLTELFGLKKLAVCLTRMCIMYLGLEEREWCAQADTKTCRALMKYIMNCGDLGRKRNQIAIMRNHTVKEMISRMRQKKKGILKSKSIVLSYIKSRVKVIILYRNQRKLIKKFRN